MEKDDCIIQRLINWLFNIEYLDEDEQSITNHQGLLRNVR